MRRHGHPVSALSLVPLQTAIAWDLRGRLFSGQEVVVLIPDGEIPRVRGLVIGVSPTDAVAWMDDARFPEPVAVDLSKVASVRRPHFHEEGDAPERRRPIFEPRRDPEPMEGQLSLGAQRVPAVSRRSVMAMQRAVGMLLSQDLLDVLAALDLAARGRHTVTTTDVLDAVMTCIDGEEIRPTPSVQWTVRSLRALADLGLAYVEEARPLGWAPGD